MQSTSNDEKIEATEPASNADAPVDSLPGFAGALADVPPPRLARMWQAAKNSANLLSIIGNRDDRRPELQTKSAPWRAICSLEIATARGPFRGTGWFAGPRLVVTAGHCVYKPSDFGGWASSITVLPGRSGKETPFGPFTSSKFSCAAEWLSAGRKDADIGCIHLAEPVGDNIGWLAVAVFDGADAPRTSVTVTGYPEYGGSYNHLLTATGKVSAAKSGRLFYEADTTDGQSGSPVWIAGTSGNPTVVAVHAYEAETSPPEVPTEANSAALMTQEVIALISRWQRTTA